MQPSGRVCSCVKQRKTCRKNKQYFVSNYILSWRKWPLQATVGKYIVNVLNINKW